MFPRLLLLGLLAALGWLVGRALGPTAAARRGAQRPGRPATERVGGAMVRDRVCNTFIPRADAQTLSLDGREHHFCSDACRERFLRDNAASADTVA